MGFGSIGVKEFVKLDDTPSSYSGQSGKAVKVKAAEDAVEFGDIPTALAVKKDSGAVIGTRGIINLRQGVGIALQVEDDAADGEVEITLGSSTPHRHMILLPEDAILPTSNPPAKVTTDGANFSYETLDYDQATEEKAYWERWLSPDYKNENITADIFWKATPAAGNVKWGIQVLGRKEGETWDAALGTEKTVVDATGGAEVVNKASVQTFPPNWEGQDILMFKIARKAADGEDTLAGDAEILKVVIKYTTTFNQAFYPLATPIQLTVYNDWNDVDVSAYVPVGATGVWLQVVNDAADSFRKAKFRMKGSSEDELTNIFGTVGYRGQEWVWVGLDENRIFQGDNLATVWLVGYTGGNVVFFENPIDKTPATGSWQDIDVSAECPNCIGVIYRMRAVGGSGVRRNGSTDEYLWQLSGSNCAVWGVIGTDNQIFEAYIAGGQVWILGYILDGATFLTTAVDKSPAVKDSYQDVDFSGYDKIIVPFLNRADAGSYEFAVRKKGWTTDIYKCGGQSACCAAAPCDSNGKQEIKISSLNLKLVLIGYATHSG
ncbi:hypothetical protein ES703_28685 [subsurface metagenome]